MFLYRGKIVAFFSKRAPVADSEYGKRNDGPEMLEPGYGNSKLEHDDGYGNSTRS